MMSPLSRREFVATTASLTVGGGLARAAGRSSQANVLTAAATEPGPGIVSAEKVQAVPVQASAARRRLTFSAMVTLGDWAAFNGVWGEPGVFYILRRMRDAGFSRVYWRTTDGCGQACYPSHVTNAAQQFIRDEKRFVEQRFIREFLDQAKPTGTEWLQGSADFGTFDSVRAGRDWAHKMGLEFYCWHEHAEDHGRVGQISRMGMKRPEWFTRNRDGKPSGCRFSWAIRPAIDYRLALVREVLAHEPDGFVFDFVKSMEGTPDVGCTPHWDEKGVWYCTYDEPAIDAFKRKTGRDPFQIPNDDPEWVRFRAGYMTDFVRRAREMQQKEFPKVKLGVFGCPRGRTGLYANDKNGPLADPLNAYLEDHETWTREGLIDVFVNAYNDGTVSRDPARHRAMIEDARSRVHAPCHYRGTQLEVYGLREEAAILKAVETIAEAGCEEVVLFETTPLEQNRTWDVVKKAVQQFGA